MDGSVAAAGPATPTVLGVERSFTGRRWRSRLADDRPAYALAEPSSASPNWWPAS